MSRAHLVLAAWLTTAALASTAGAGEQVGCLPREAGDVVSRLVQQGRIAAAAPRGWTLVSANIEVTRLVLRFESTSGEEAGVRLHARGVKKTAASGRWFAYEPFGDDAAWLTAAAAVVDRGFETSPWIDCPEVLGMTGPPPERTHQVHPPKRIPEPAKHPPKRSPQPVPPPPQEPVANEVVDTPAPPDSAKEGDPAPIDSFMRSRYWFLPPWLYLLVGLLEYGVLIAGIGLILASVRGRRASGEEFE